MIKPIWVVSFALWSLSTYPTVANVHPNDSNSDAITTRPSLPKVVPNTYNEVHKL